MPPAIVASLDLCTAGLGLFLAAPLWAMRRQRPANGWLAAFLASLALLALADFCHDAGLQRQFPWLFGLFDWPLACLGASYYLYVRGLTGLPFGRRQLWHVLPMAPWCALLLAQHAGLGRALFVPALLLLQLLTLAYAVAVLWRLRQYRRRLRDNYSSTERRELHWLTWLSAAFIALLLVWLPALAMGGAWDAALLAGRIAVLAFTGWFGMRQVAVFLPVPAVAEDSPRYARSGMTAAAADEIGLRLRRRAASQRDFLERELTLAELAGRIGTTPNLLSQYLNDSLQQSFYDYINGLRVAEVQRLMCDPAHGSTALLDLSLAAGFNSRSTFNAAFKKTCGMAPSQWRKEHATMSEPIGTDDKQPA